MVFVIDEPLTTSSRAFASAAPIPTATAGSTGVAKKQELGIAKPIAEKAEAGGEAGTTTSSVWTAVTRHGNDGLLR